MFPKFKDRIFPVFPSVTFKFTYLNINEPYSLDLESYFFLIWIPNCCSDIDLNSIAYFLNCFSVFVEGQSISGLSLQLHLSTLFMPILSCVE